MIPVKYSSEAEESILLIDKMIYQLADLKYKCSSFGIKKQELDQLSKNLNKTKSDLVQAQESLKKLQEINSQTENHRQEISKKNQEKNDLINELNSIEEQIKEKQKIGDTYDRHVELMEKLLEQNLNVQLICKELVVNPDYQEIIRRIELLKREEKKIESEKENVKINYIESCKEIQDLKNLLQTSENEIMYLKQSSPSKKKKKSEKEQLEKVRDGLQSKIQELTEQSQSLDNQISEIGEKYSNTLKKDEELEYYSRLIEDKKSLIESQKLKNQQEVEEIESKSKIIQQENENLKKIAQEYEKKLRIANGNS